MHRPGRGSHSRVVVGVDQQRRPRPGVAGLDHGVVARHNLGLRTRPDEHFVLSDERGDVAGELDAGRREDDEVVADPFQVGDDVRGEQHGQSL